MTDPREAAKDVLQSRKDLGDKRLNRPRRERSAYKELRIRLRASTSLGTYMNKHGFERKIDEANRENQNAFIFLMIHMN